MLLLFHGKITAIAQVKAPRKLKANRKNVREAIDIHLNMGEYKQASELVHRFRVSGYTICKSTLAREYNVPKNIVDNLCVFEVKNPVYKTAAPMKLYFKVQVAPYLKQEYRA